MTSVAGHLRQQVILEQLHAHRHVRIRDLAARLHVSHPTVVRDLTALERRALIRRVHGGALMVSTVGGDAAATRSVPSGPGDRSIRAAVRASRVMRAHRARPSRSHVGTG